MLHFLPRSFARVRSTALAAALATGMLAALSGCSDSTASGMVRTSILLTDAPGDVQHAVVTISRIYLQGSSGRVDLLTTPVTTDLLTLADSTASLVKDAVVPAGRYAELRFVVTGAYIEVENQGGGTSIYASSPTYEGLPAGAQVSGTLQMPSYAQTGIKVTLPGGAVTLSGDQKILLVDFDVSQSFGHQAGDSGSWVMHPVIRATDFETTGGLTVTLSKDSSVTMPTVNGSVVGLNDFTAVVTGPDSSTRSTAFQAGSDGRYEAHFPFLAPGSYSVDITGPSGVTFTTSPSHPATVTVPSGGSASQAFTLTSASAAQ